MKAIDGVGTLTVELDGDALSPDEAACLGALRVRHALSVPAQCELVFHGIGEDLAGRAAGLIGVSLAVRGEDGAVFDGEVTAVEHEYSPDGGKDLRVRAYDLLHRLRKRQSVEFRVNVDAGEICQQFAGDLGLDVDVSEAGPRWERLAQWQQTDFDLLAAVGTIGGGRLSSSLRRRRWSVNAARQPAMRICALGVVPIVVAANATNLWIAVGLISLAAAAHQGWSANLYTLTSDMFPRQAVGSVVGIGGMAGAVGGMLIALVVGEILARTGSYVPIFLIAGFAYLVALAVVHVLAPRLTPARL